MALGRLRSRDPLPSPRPVPAPQAGARRPRRRHFQKVPAAAAEQTAAAPARARRSRPSLATPLPPPTSPPRHCEARCEPVIPRAHGRERAPPEGRARVPRSRCRDGRCPLPSPTTAVTPVPPVRATWAGRGQWELRGALLEQRRWGRGRGAAAAAQGEREGGRERGRAGEGRGVFKPGSHSGQG